MPTKTKAPVKRTKRTKKEVSSDTPVAPAATTTVAPVASKVAEEASDVVPYQHVIDQLHEQTAALNALTGQCQALKKSYSALEKVVVRELKAAHKSQQKKKKKQGNRAPSGFVKPTPISSELASFLGRSKGEQMARTEVTREINAYIRKHSLQDPDNGRKINPDSALKTLLKLTSKDELTYFNLQKYMSPHFQKAGAAPIL